MILIFWKGKVGKWVAELCDYLWLSYDMLDDTDVGKDFSPYSQIIPSPGISGTHAIYDTGKVMSELDFVSQYLPHRFQTIAITGTDGKSTATWMLYNILQKEYFGKKSVYISGNFDIPFSSTVLEILRKWEKTGYIVLEVSSFMSHSLHYFSPDYSILLNLKPDHLNWHTDIGEYLDAKMHLLERTKKKSILNQQVIDFANEKNLKITVPNNARIFQFTSERIFRDMTNGEDIIISGRRKYQLSETHFSGLHNAMNILACVLVTHEMKICSKHTKKYLSEIRWLPHRLEKIGEKNGIIFIEDSKSTSSQSLEAALSSYGEKKNLLLIVGWSDKWDSFMHLAWRFHHRVKALVCMGTTKNHFIQIAEQENIEYFSTDSIPDAVTWLYEKWVAWDVLMLSPWCASFGLFRDYLHRAEVYREAIKNLR